MKFSGFRTRQSLRSRVTAACAATAPVALAVGLLVASGAPSASAETARDNGGALTTPSGLLPTPSALLGGTTSSNPSGDPLCQSPSPAPLSPLPTLSLCPSLSPSPSLPSGTPSPGGSGGGPGTSSSSPSPSGSAGGAGSTGGSTSGTGGGGGAASTPLPAGSTARGVMASAQQLVGALVVADPLLAAQAASVLQNPVSQQPPDLLHFSLASATGAAVSAEGANDTSGGVFGGSNLPSVLMALAGACLVAAGTGMLLLRRFSARIRLAAALAPIACGIPLSAAAATTITSVAVAPVSMTTVSAPVGLLADAESGGATLGQVRAVTRPLPTQAPAWTQLVAIENGITAEHAQLVTSEQQIAQLATLLKQPAPDALEAPGHHPSLEQQWTDRLSSLVQQHTVVDVQYQQELQREYDYFLQVAESPAMTAQVQNALPSMPAAVRSAVAYDLSTVRTQLQQQAAIDQAMNAPGIGSANALAAQLASHAKVTFHAPLSGLLTQGFGPTIWSMEPPITYNGVFYPHFHTGLDIAAPEGTPVGAAAGGVVILAGSSRDAAGNLVGYGNYVVIRHANGCLTLYGHLEQLLVTTGQVVQQGQVIGLCGSTGWSTGPHVHFEIRIDGVYVNPLPFIEGQVRS